MSTSLFALAAIGLSAATLHASELAIEKSLFEIPITLDAEVMPQEPASLVAIAPKTWRDFTIRTLADHGSVVRKGDLLVGCDPLALDREIQDSTAKVAARQHEIDAVQSALAELEETAEARVAALRHAAAVARDDHQYFLKTGRKAREDKAAQDLETRKQWLQNQQEELRQLKAMYEADDLTEDTEEIILVRQQNAVSRAEFDLHMEQLAHDRELQVQLPRTAIALAEAERRTTTELKYAEARIPLEIATKQASLLELKTTQQRAQQRLADLKHDRALCEIKAPANGVFYHGALRGGRWVTGDLLRNQRVGAAAPLDTAFASLVPDAAAFVLVAHAKPETARMLAAGTEAAAYLLGAQDRAFTATITGLSGIPETDGTHRILFKPGWDKTTRTGAAVGNPARIELVAHRNPEAITIPAKALRFGSDGWTVALKLADGRTERRPVQRGLQSGETVEILSGLEPGQVIIAP